MYLASGANAYLGWGASGAAPQHESPAPAVPARSARSGPSTIESNQIAEGDDNTEPAYYSMAAGGSSTTDAGANVIAGVEPVTSPKAASSDQVLMISSF